MGGGTGAARRRRGGRGRGGRGSGQRPEVSGETDAPASTTGADDQEQPKSTPRTRAPRPAPGQGARKPQADRQRAPRERVGADELTGDTVGTSNDAQDASAKPRTGEEGTGAPRRRSRGGRGRGSGTGQGLGPRPSASRADEDFDKDVDDDAPMTDTPETQREDALPDQETTGSRNRRRGRRGTGSSKAEVEADADDMAKSDRSSSGRASSEKSLEAHIAAGGSTRGIRSSRSRTGRVGSRDGRRRREPEPTPPRITDKLMVITEHGDRDQIAVLEQEALVQHYVTRTGATSMVGNVYLGRVQNVLPGMEAAFVDFGRGRNGVLYAGEVNYTPEDLEGPAPRIEHVLKAGQAVMVQVTKDPMGGKGARLTAQISMPGRFLVLAPDQAVSGISRRLPDEERKRLKAILKKVRPESHGVIVRTAAEGASEEALTTDLERLVREWDEINRKAKKAKAPAVLYEEPELTVRVFRDLFNDEEYRGLVTDSQSVYDKIMSYVSEVAPDLAPKISLHTGKLPAFEEHRIVEQIHKALDRKVWLPSGGYLIIERTEAMTIVDVNTGKAVGKTNLEETVRNTNLEAASEVGRQLRLRDIGGIIVIDFIDMLLEKNKKQVEDTMRDALAVDKTRSQVFEIGPLGIMQVTRKRVSGGLVESFSETCPTCEGRGILVNYEA